jgi:flagellar protein FliO/FliZ
MTETLLTVGLFVVLLALVPVAIKWSQRRSVGGASGMASSLRVVSAVAVGQHQRVVTVEAGPENARIWLVLGVTAQSITCLHSLPAGPAVTSNAPGAVVGSSAGS